ncbi:MAG: hypothetical protein ACRDUV_26715, partial [Pseudonocardiaceae bacterium]
MTSNGQIVYCPRCGAQLRRDQPIGAVCDPCGKAGHAPLPPEFFLPEPVQAALATYQFGVFFRRVRGYKDWCQGTLGKILDLTQAQISRIEGGGPLHDIRIIARMHERLGIPAPLLGFGDPATVSGRTTTAREGSWMDRRDFVQRVAALGLGSAGVTALDIDRLVALLHPDTDATSTRRIGAADVAALEHATAEYERSNYTFGGGLAREAAVSQLRAILPLLNQPMDDSVQPRLHIAATHLALLAGWMSFDVEHHDAARRLWVVGLDIARGTEHPLATDLTSHLMLIMAQQARYLGRPDEARQLVQLGYTAGAGSHPVSASTSTALATNAAFAHADRGHLADCQRALGDAEDAFTRIDPANVTPWACVDGPIKIATWQGHAYYELARTSGDQRCMQRAVTLLGQAVDNPRAMSRALYLPDLAGAEALAGDVDTAVALGHQAVDTVTAMTSRRNYARLRVLN